MQVDDDEILLDLQEEHPELFTEYRNALSLLGQLLRPTDVPFTPSKLQEAVFRLFGRALQLFRSILLLGRFGYNLDCVVLVRALVELTINAYYLAFEKRRQGLHRFRKHGRVEQWVNFNKLLQFQTQHGQSPTVGDVVGKERVREMRRLARRDEREFLSKKGTLLPTWARIGLRERAKFVDQRFRTPGRLEGLYIVAYAQSGSPVTHSTALGLSQIPPGDGEVMLDASPSGHLVPECLRLSLACLFLMAQLGNRVGKLQRDALVRRIEDACRP